VERNGSARRSGLRHGLVAPPGLGQDVAGTGGKIGLVVGGPVAMGRWPHNYMRTESLPSPAGSIRRLALEPVGKGEFFDQRILACDAGGGVRDLSVAEVDWCELAGSSLQSLGSLSHWDYASDQYLWSWTCVSDLQLGRATPPNSALDAVDTVNTPGDNCPLHGGRRHV